MEFLEVSINDKPLFDRYFKTFQPQISEMTFSNIFMWRNYYGFRYAEICGMLCIISVGRNWPAFAFAPVGEYEEQKVDLVVAALREYFMQRGWRLRLERVDAAAMQYLKKYALSEGDILYSRDNSDYIYLSSDLVSLKGKKFDGKRNHINKFKKTYSYEYVGFDSESVQDMLLEECRRILEEWCLARNGETGSDELRHEMDANMELLNNFRELDCKGALIKVDGRFEAFTVGEMLNNDTAVIHIEKANARINGLYAFINQQFCEKQWKNVRYINREQDLGLQGLRKAKLSYNPVQMIDKYIIIAG